VSGHVAVATVPNLKPRIRTYQGESQILDFKPEGIFYFILTQGEFFKFIFTYNCQNPLGMKHDAF
jgi:hypothetical protein